MTYELRGVEVLVLGIAVWFLGTWLTSKIRTLRAFNIPAAVTLPTR